MIAAVVAAYMGSTALYQWAEQGLQVSMPKKANTTAGQHLAAAGVQRIQHPRS